MKCPEQKEFTETEFRENKIVSVARFVTTREIGQETYTIFH